PPPLPPPPPPPPPRPAPEVATPARPAPERVAPSPPPRPPAATRPDRLAGTQPVPGAAAAPAPGRAPGGPRRARQVIRRFDLWSVLRFSLIFYLCMFLILLVAGIVLWVVATITGVRGNIENFISDLIASKFHFLGLQLLRGAAIGGLLLVIIGSAANMLMALLYNL